jgi:predicted HTH domain antitoxin
MNEHNEIPNYQDELLQLNELLERLHRLRDLNILKLKKEKIEDENNEKFEREKSVQINIYEKGSQHIDTQINWKASPPAPASPLTPLQLARGTLGERGVDSFEKTRGLPWEKSRQGEGGCLRQKRGGELPFGADTPLSALFRKNHHEELRKRIESWRPYLKSDAPETDALLMTWFEFDKDRIYANKVYRDLCELDHMGALNNSLSCLARYLAGHSNLSRSYSTLYQQLKLYRSESR